MNAVPLIRELKQAGIQLSATGDRIHVEAPAGAVTAELRQRIAENKAGLLVELQRRAATDGREAEDCRASLLALSAEMGIPASVVEALPAAELEATAEQIELCKGHLDGTGDPLPHALLTFYLRTLADRVTP